MGLVFGSGNSLCVVARTVRDKVRSRIIAFGSIEARLNEFFAFPQRHNRLQLGRCKGIHMSRLAGDQHECLRSGKRGKFVRLGKE